MLQFHSLNNLAILVSAIILWVLGAIWYSPPLFAKSWMELAGVKREPGNRDGMLLAMTASFIGDLVLSFVLATIVMWSNATGFKLGGVIGVLVWMAFFAAPNLPQGLYEKKPFKLFAINGTYWLLGLFIVGGLLASWR
ncbi:MAG TPA: DUF1761 domain-containing protein [Terracidiphilus sp.]|jgi:hypothetical protein